MAKAIVNEELRQEIEAFCGCENDCDYFEDKEGKAFGVPTVGMKTNFDGNSLAELTEYLIDCDYRDVNKILGDIKFVQTDEGKKNEVYFLGVRP